MATSAIVADGVQIAPWRVWRRVTDPTIAFVLVALLILGGCALRAALGHWVHQPNRDLYQHVATLRALSVSLLHPANPFVATDDGSRHFHPYWVSMAILARIFGWSVWQTIGVAGFISMGVLAAGIFMFAREYYQSRWGPLALLVCALLGWSMPISHTGFLSVPTLVEGASYPAVLIWGASLILWTLVLRALKDPRINLIIAPLVALMFATHQLGTGLGLIVGTCLLLFSPGADRSNRIWIAVAFAGGLILSCAWPYHNPIRIMLEAGNPSWQNGVEWFSPKYLIGMLVPSAIGMLGLLRPNVPGTGRPLLIALPILIAGFLTGAFGFLTGTRFAPAAILVLQIGMGAILVRFLDSPEQHGDKFKLTLAGTAFGTVLFQVLALGIYYYPLEYRQQERLGDVYAEALKLTASVPDSESIAAYDVAAWPISASGQKVLSIPWPEPGIPDLARRQAIIERLFDPSVTRDQRVALARATGVRTLIFDERFGKKGPWPYWQEFRLYEQAKAISRAGPVVRLDLY